MNYDKIDENIDGKIPGLNHKTADYIYIVRKLDDTDSDAVNSVVKLVERAAVVHGLEITTDRQSIRHKRTIIVAVGGDGTMLQAMNIAASHQCVVLGINLGKVGFLSDYATDDKLYTTLVDVFQDGAYLRRIEKRIALQYQEGRFGADNFNHYYIAFNEFVISNRFSDHHIKYRLMIDDVDAGWHKANSLIVSTPTGSTAYTLSVGGGLMLPTLEALQIIPVAPFKMTSRPIIVPADSRIRVEIETKGEWMLKGDGVIVASGDSPGDVELCKSPDVATMIHPDGWNFFDVLSQKLGWMRDE